MHHRPRRHALLLVSCLVPALLLAASMPRRGSASIARPDGPASLPAAAQGDPRSDGASQWTHLANMNRIDAMALDAEAGEIWSASAGGVVLWDIQDRTGQPFTTREGLASNAVRAIVLDGEDTWFATGAGLSRLSAGGQWRTFRVADGLVHDDVRSLAVAPDGALWVGTWGGLSVRAPDGTWRSYTKASTDGRLASDHVQALLVSERDRWIGTWNGGLVHWRVDETGETWHTYETDSLEADGHTLVSDNVREIALDPSSGDLWFASAGRWDPVLQHYFPGALSRMTPDGRWSLFDDDRDLLSETILDLQVSDDGVLWLGTAEGASRIEIARSATFTHLTPEHSDLAHERVSAVRIGPRGDLYFGSGDGISHLAPDGRWSHMRRDSDLPSNSVQAVALDALREHAWFGTRDGLARLDAATGEVEQIHTSFGRYANWINDIAIDDAGTTWLGTGLYDPTFRSSQRYRGGGLIELRADGSQVRHTRAIPGQDGLSHDLVFDVEPDEEGTTWIGTWQGLSRVGPLEAREPDTKRAWRPALEAPPATLRIDDGDMHPALEGMIGMPLASYGPAGVEGELAVHGYACYHTFEKPVEDVAGKIALVEQGNCWSSDNIETAERNGAIAVVVYAGPDREPMRMEGDDKRIGIPGVMIDRELGLALRARRANSETMRARLHAADPAQGLVRDDIRAIAHVAQGTWLATWGGGVAFVDHADRVTSFTTASTGGGLTDDRVVSLAEAPDGTMWFGTDRAGISRRTADGRWLAPLTGESTGGALLGDRVTSLAFAADGTLWVGTSGREDPLTYEWLRGGLNGFTPDGTWRQYRSEGGRSGDEGLTLPDDNVLALATGGQGQLLIGTHGGAFMRTWRTHGGCAGAVPIASGAHESSSLRLPGDAHYYRFEVERPHSQVVIGAPDPDDALRLRLLRACHAGPPGSGGRIDSDSGRKISSSQWDAERGMQLIERDLGSDIGTFYIEILRKDGSPHDSGDGTEPLDYGFSLDVTAVDDGVRSLILTDLDALAGHFSADPSAEAGVRDALERLAADPRVRGRVVTDLGALLGGSYRRWLDGDHDPATARAAADQLRAWIHQQRARLLPHLRYVVLVGDDRIIPHYRYHVPSPGDAEWATEAEYLDGGTAGTIPSGSSVRPSLAEDLTLGDDFYGASAAETWGEDQAIHIPQLAIGRLVEQPRDIRYVIDSFLGDEEEGTKGASEGPAADRGPRPIRRSLVVGWDFMQDGPAEGARRLEAAGHPGRVERLLGDRWAVEILRERMRGTRFDLAFLGMHANHFAYEAPSGALHAADLRDDTSDRAGALAYSLSCHGGLNVPGADDLPTGEPLDLPEAWLGTGVNYVSSSGWAYGMQGALGYQEALMVDFTTAIAEGGGTAVGDALMRVKQDYFTTHEMNAYHVKTLVGTVLYGLPMASYRLAEPEPGREPGVGTTEHALYLPMVVARGNRGRRPLAAGAGRGVGQATSSSERPVGQRGVDADSGEGGAPPVDRASRPMLSVVRPAQLVPGRTMAQTLIYKDLEAHLERRTTTQGSYYTIAGQRPFAEHGLAVQPKLSQELRGVTLGSRHLPLRGVMLRDAEYRTTQLDAPVVARAGILSPRARRHGQGAASTVRPEWSPGHLVRLRRLDAALEPRAPTLLVYLGQYHAAQRQQRLYDRVEIEAFYSDLPDATPPAILDVEVEAQAEVNGRAPAGGSRAARASLVRVRASDAQGVEAVSALCDDGRGHWRAHPLHRAAEREVWQGLLPPVDAGQGCLVQAVDGAGNTVVDDRGGAMYGRPAP